MTVRLRPETFVTDAARAEGSTESDWRHYERMMTEAFGRAFEVGEIQRDGTGLIAYDSPYSNFEAVTIDETSEKPVLDALTALSKNLLNLKSAHEREQPSNAANGALTQAV